LQKEGIRGNVIPSIGVVFSDLLANNNKLKEDAMQHIVPVGVHVINLLSKKDRIVERWKTAIYKVILENMSKSKHKDKAGSTMYWAIKYTTFLKNKKPRFDIQLSPHMIEETVIDKSYKDYSRPKFAGSIISKKRNFHFSSKKMLVRRESP
jgi:hypothetical protein